VNCTYVNLAGCQPIGDSGFLAACLYVHAFPSPVPHVEFRILCYFRRCVFGTYIQGLAFAHAEHHSSLHESLVVISNRLFFQEKQHNSSGKSILLYITLTQTG